MYVCMYECSHTVCMYLCICVCGGGGGPVFNGHAGTVSLGMRPAGACLGVEMGHGLPFFWSLSWCWPVRSRAQLLVRADFNFFHLGASHLENGRSRCQLVREWRTSSCSIMFGHSSSEGNRCFEHPSVASCGPCMMILRLLVLAGLQGTPQLHTEEILGLRKIEAGSGDLNYANFVPCWLSQFWGIVQWMETGVFDTPLLAFAGLVSCRLNAVWWRARQPVLFCLRQRHFLGVWDHHFLCRAPLTWSQ